MMDRQDMSSVIFLTNYYKIKGYISLMPGTRLTDYMNETKDFIAVTDAEVFARESGKKLLAGEFLNVQRSNIEVAMPTEKVKYGMDE